MTESLIEVEAETLLEAHRQIKSQVPENLHLISERVISDGKPRTVRAVANTLEAAYVKAQAEIPPDATILEKKELCVPDRQVIKFIVEAFTQQDAEYEARMQALERFGPTMLKSLNLTRNGHKGFLRIGGKPNQYEAEVIQQAIIEVTYRTRARIVATVGSRQQDQEARSESEIKTFEPLDETDAPKLIQQLESSIPNTIEQASYLLGRMVEPRALPALERVVGRQNVDDQHVTSTFERMNIPLPDSFPKQPPGTITDTGAIAAAEKAISNIVHGDEEPLLLAMKDINAEVRESVVDALSRRPPTNRAIETLIAASNEDESPRVRRKARLALVKMGSPTVEPLIDALQDKNPQHRMSTAWTLYWIWHKHRTERIAELLMDAMKKRDMAIIGAAYGFFITQSQPGTESILIRALNEHGDPEMAEHFLNCGNSKLRSAATRWANIHNYQFIHSSSSGGPIWLDLGGRK